DIHLLLLRVHLRCHRELAEIRAAGDRLGLRVRPGERGEQDADQDGDDANDDEQLYERECTMRTGADHDWSLPERVVGRRNGIRPGRACALLRAGLHPRPLLSWMLGNGDQARETGGPREWKG